MRVSVRIAQLTATNGRPRRRPTSESGSRRAPCPCPSRRRSGRCSPAAITRTKSKTARILGLRPMTTSSSEKSDEVTSAPCATLMPATSAHGFQGRLATAGLPAPGALASPPARNPPAFARHEPCAATRMLATPDLVRTFDRPGPRYTSHQTAVEFTEQFGQRAYLERLDQAAALEHEPLSPTCTCPSARRAARSVAARSSSRRSGGGRPLSRIPETGNRAAGRLRRRQSCSTTGAAARRRILNRHSLPIFSRPSATTSTSIHAAKSRSRSIPRATTLEHVDTLRSLGFNRLSLGVQDFTERVQEAINRRQPGSAYARPACPTRARPGSNRSTST